MTAPGPQMPRVQIIICRLFTGTLTAGEALGECHGCGRAVIRDAGVIPPAAVTRIMCVQCAEFWPLPPPGLKPDPRAGEGCVCSRPVECPCGFTCFLCGGLLQPAVTLAP